MTSSTFGLLLQHLLLPSQEEGSHCQENCAYLKGMELTWALTLPLTREEADRVRGGVCVALGGSGISSGVAFITAGVRIHVQTWEHVETAR